MEQLPRQMSHRGEQHHDGDREALARDMPIYCFHYLGSISQVMGCRKRLAIWIQIGRRHRRLQGEAD
jgi:hypothetical protein